jgi:hypothetical protein
MAFKYSEGELLGLCLGPLLRPPLAQITFYITVETPDCTISADAVDSHRKCGQQWPELLPPQELASLGK